MENMSTFVYFDLILSDFQVTVKLFSILEN